MTRNLPTLMSALLVALTIVCGGCHDPSAVLTVILAVKGEVTKSEPAGGRFTPGAEFAAPSTIHTGPDGAVVFSPLPGMMVRLESDGEISLNRVQLRKRGEEIVSRTASLNLRKGRARVWVDEFRQGTTEIQLQTSAGEAKFNGPVLAEVAAEPDGGGSVICVSGEMSAAGSSLKSGQWATLARGQSAPAAQLAADTDEIWRRLLEVRNLEPQFLDLAGRQRQRTPIHRAIPPTKN
jgi:hypothetical protein